MKRTVNVDVQPSVDELAEEFCELGAAEQADFFHAVARRFRDWGYHADDAQLYQMGLAMKGAPNTAAGVEWLRRLLEFEATLSENEGT